MSPSCEALLPPRSSSRPACRIASAQAQSWPSRPVKIVVPFAPGGTADLFGRIAAEHLSKAFGQQFVIENRGGAGGLTGSAAVAQAEPDGYTLLISGIPTLVVAPAASANPPFDPMRDFTHIAYLGGVPLTVIAHPSLGAANYKEFIALAKKSDKGLGYVSPGAGTHAHLFGDYLARKESVKLEHIPYKGAGPAMMDLLAGHVPLGVMSWSASIQQIRAGKVQALAVSSVERQPEFPNVPTFKELGYDDLTAATWFSLSGPPKLPQRHRREAQPRHGQRPAIARGAEAARQRGGRGAPADAGAVPVVRRRRDQALEPDRQGDEAGN